MKGNSLSVCLVVNPILGVALLLAAIQVIPQTRKPVDPLPTNADRNVPDDEQNGSSMADEMRIKREIMYAEKEHRQKLDRAKETSELAQQLATSFKGKSSLDRDDIKKLEKLEKLAKWLRSEAGGSDNEVNLEKKPTNASEAICAIAEVSTALSNLVKETPRQVISASIIDKANVLLELIQIARSFSPKV